MELALFDHVGELVRTLVPAGQPALRVRAGHRGVKVWFGNDRPERFHYEAQVVARKLIDGVDGLAVEVGFHAEHPDEARNRALLDDLLARADGWRPDLGDDATAGAFLGHAPDWRRLSETWIEPDLGDPDLPFELASRLADYIAALEPIVRGAATPP